MKKVFGYILFTFIIGTFLFLSSPSSDDDTIALDNSKLIKFSHQFHVEDNEIECADCHTTVTESLNLNDRLLPNHENCSDCHDVEDTDNCITCHFDDNFEPLIQSKSELNFNHKIHVTDQKLECVSCHKGIADFDYAFEAPNSKPNMETCYSCHNDGGVAFNTLNCESCHKITANLIPQTHKSFSFIKTHKFSAQNIKADCAMCHQEQTCQDCHTATNVITENNTIAQFFQPYSPSKIKDGIKQQQITRVHELNFRMTHGIEARGKTINCESCHQIQTFCANCHGSNNEDFALGGIVPTSHLKPNFKTLGVGTGGGLHATLARRDIESCAACHDVQGADPTCITCHLDSDGIKGTNPKTHPPNFMRDVKGDWHNDPGSVCFNCHSGSSTLLPARLGFCGYCHGSTKYID